jgi:hypothetical protein
MTEACSSLDTFKTAFHSNGRDGLILRRIFCDRFKVFALLLPKIETVAIAMALADPHMEWNHGESDSFDKYTQAAVGIVTNAYATPVFEKGIYNSILTD